MTKATMICDMQYGSTGKGLIAGYLARKHGYEVAVSANMPNAGHTFVYNGGTKVMFKCLPIGAISQQCRYALIGPGAVFSPKRLEEEVEIVKSVRGITSNSKFQVVIHPNAMALQEKHKQIEKDMIGDIGSTYQGTVGAMIEKICRNSDNSMGTAITSYAPNSVYVVVASHDSYREILDWAPKILIEGAQGFSLGVHERFYPYCTSRDCSPAQILADTGVPVDYLGIVIGTARTYPIRVGGNSGGSYHDQTEIQWEDVGQEPEYTTVTNRMRRVFTFSRKQIADAMWQIRPDYVFLNFCNYLGRDSINGLIDQIEVEGRKAGEGVGKVVFLGWGPMENGVEEISGA